MEGKEPLYEFLLQHVQFATQSADLRQTVDFTARSGDMVAVAAAAAVGRRRRVQQRD